jgi:hypothetical protein
VRAHKLILSACSAFFKDLLITMNADQSNSAVQPLIYLSGIDFEDLQVSLNTGNEENKLPCTSYVGKCKGEQASTKLNVTYVVNNN